MTLHRRIFLFTRSFSFFFAALFPSRSARGFALRGVFALVIAAAFLVAFAGPFGPGSLWAQGGYEDGMAAYEDGDYLRAVKIWRPLAEAGDANAQYGLGKLYETGGGDLARDYARAAKWYR
ncbi:MAG: sel1 repeat family protein, partial [Alphaproteobacteria bacterium]